MTEPPLPESDAAPAKRSNSGDEVGSPSGKRPAESNSGVDATTVTRSDDPDNADTDPFAVQNPYGVGWGAGWGGSWTGVSATEASARAVQRSERSRSSEAPKHTSRPVLGDVELPSAPESFAFPASSPGWADRGRALTIGLGALATIAAVGGLIFWLLSRSPTRPATEAAESATRTTENAATSSATTPPRRDAAAEEQLMRILPPGYPPGSCKAVEPILGATATVDCTNNADPGGPTSATYLLAADRPALDAALTTAVPPEATVVCPGNIQSPGPWRRNAAPERVAGTLVCGIQGNVATVGWTDVERMLVSLTHSTPPGPGLDQLYQWWSTHS